MHRALLNNGEQIGMYKVLEKLGEGAFGQVFKVKGGQKHYAAKVEEVSEESTMDLEIAVLKRLAGRLNFTKFEAEGVHGDLRFVVMELAGQSLEKLTSGKPIPPSSWARVGVQLLYGVKLLHDCGFIHRDLKPANVAVGLGEKSRIFIILDFGLARRITECDMKGEIVLRRARPSALFRGSVPFASPAAHQKLDLSRKDDLWSLVYLIASLARPLPWMSCSEEEVEFLKKNAHLEQLFIAEGRGWLSSAMKGTLTKLEMSLRKADFYSNPNYSKLYEFLLSVLARHNVSWGDAFCWETETRPTIPKTFPWMNAASFFSTGPLNHLTVPKLE